MEIDGIARNEMTTIFDTNVFYNHQGIAYNKVWLDNPKDEKSKIISIPYNITNIVLYLYLAGIKNKVILINKPELSLHLIFL